MTVSIEQPAPASGLGYWPAFRALGSPMRTGGTWPTSGEIDMMEDVNALNEASQTLRDAASSSGHPLIACPGAGSGCQAGYLVRADLRDPDHGGHVERHGHRHGYHRSGRVGLVQLDGTGQCRLCHMKCYGPVVSASSV